MAWQEWQTNNVVSTLNVGGKSYAIKDSVAKNNIEELKSLINTINGSVLHFIGITTTVISDGDKTNTIQIDGQTYNAKNGDVVIYQHDDGLAGTNEEEYVWVGEAATGKWQEFGSTGALKALAFKDSASGTYTPAGTVSQPTFSGAEGNISVSGTPAGTISPIAASGTGDYTPAGTINKPAVNVDTTTANGYLVTANGTLPSLTVNDVSTTAVISSATYDNETLTFTSAVFAPGTTATLEATPSALATVSAELEEAPEFSGTATGFAFSGSSLTSTGTFTPGGTVSQPTFSGTQATITVE